MMCQPRQRSRVVLADPQLKHSWLRVRYMLSLMHSRSLFHTSASSAKVTHQLESGLESRDSAPLLDKIQGYYSNAGATMGKDAAVLFAKQSVYLSTLQCKRNESTMVCDTSPWCNFVTQCNASH
eukprot:3172463-Amphidinium_carterae.1